MILNLNEMSAQQLVSTKKTMEVEIPLSPSSVSSVTSCKSFADDDEEGNRIIPKELMISFNPPLSTCSSKERIKFGERSVTNTSIASMSSSICSEIEDRFTKTMRSKSDHTATRRYSISTEINQEKVNLSKSLHTFHVNRSRKLRRNSSCSSDREDIDCQSSHQNSRAALENSRISTPGSEKIKLHLYKDSRNSPMFSVHSNDGRDGRGSSSRRRLSLVGGVNADSTVSTEIRRRLSMASNIGSSAKETSFSHGKHRRLSMTQRQSSLSEDDLSPEYERPRRRFSITNNDRHKERSRRNSLSFPLANPGPVNREKTTKRRSSLAGPGPDRSNGKSVTDKYEIPVHKKSDVIRRLSIPRMESAKSPDPVSTTRTVRIVPRLSMGHGMSSSKHEKHKSTISNVTNYNSDQSASTHGEKPKRMPRPCLKSSKSFRNRQQGNCTQPTETNLSRSRSLPFQIHQQQILNNAGASGPTANAVFSLDNIGGNGIKSAISKPNPFLTSGAATKRNVQVQRSDPATSSGNASVGVISKSEHGHKASTIQVQRLDSATGSGRASVSGISKSEHGNATFPSISLDGGDGGAKSKPIDKGSLARLSGSAHMRIARKISLSKSSNLKPVRSFENMRGLFSVNESSSND